MNVELLEKAAYALYTSMDSQEKAKAQESLDSLTILFETSASPTLEPGSTQLLFYTRYADQVSSPYAQFLLFSRLKSLLISKLSLFKTQDLLELRSYILQFLISHPQLESFVYVCLFQLFGSLTVLSWFLANEFQNVYQDISKFLNESPLYQRIGMDLYNAVVMEMNYATSSLKKLPKHRKTAVGFKDSQLLQIFKTAMSFLSHLLKRKESKNTLETRIQESTLNLIKNCLSFDFIGVNPDESTEDIGSINVPQSWKEILVDEGTLMTFYDCFVYFESEAAHKALECLALYASTRRSLFSDTEKAAFLSRILSTSRNIVNVLSNLTDREECHHEFARVLARLKHVYQAEELLTNPDFESFSGLFTDYTISRLLLDWELNSITYLFTFWSKIASSIPHSPESRSQVQKNTCQQLWTIFQAFLSKLDTEKGISQLSGYLEDEEAFIVLLEIVSPVMRCNYELSIGCIESKLTQYYPQYELFYKNSSTGNTNTQTRRQYSILLAFCVYTGSAGIGGRMPYESTEEDDYQDGVLAATVLQMIDRLAKYTKCVDESLELSFLNFMQQFRKVYIGDSTYRASKVYKRLSDLLHLEDQNQVLDVIVKKIESNLKHGYPHALLMQKTLSLFVELANGYSSVRNLRKSETAKFLLANHSSQHFAFLEMNSNLKNRSMFYFGLSRILFAAEIDSQEAEFANFILPFQVKMQELSRVQPMYLKKPEVLSLSEGLFRDLRGFLSGCTTKKSFMLFFDWFFPYFDLMAVLLENNYNESICISILRFVSEFVSNTSQRLCFDLSSPNGVLLFQKVAKLLYSLGNHVLVTPVNPTSLWQARYKKVLIYFDIFKNTLSGKYVPFGVFGIFSDPCLDHVLDVFFKLLCWIPESDLFSFPKLTSSCFSCLSVLSGEQLNLITDLDTNVLQTVFNISVEGIKGDTYISSQACSIIDNLMSFVYKQGSRPHSLTRHILQMENTIHSILNAILEVVLWNEPDNLWSLSRPLLPLILIDQGFFRNYVEYLVNSQSQERGELLTRHFTELMDGVEQSLSLKNRDKFTQNLSSFRRELAQENILL